MDHWTKILWYRFWYDFDILKGILDILYIFFWSKHWYYLGTKRYYILLDQFLDWRLVLEVIVFWYIFGYIDVARNLFWATVLWSVLHLGIFPHEGGIYVICLDWRLVLDVIVFWVYTPRRGDISRGRNLFSLSPRLRRHIPCSF